MGNGYHQHLNHQTLQVKGTFLPMLCSKPSIKDVSLPRWHERSASFSGEPLSPKISCMGQVKRNNRIVGFPTTSNKLTLKNIGTTTTASNNTSTSTSIKYFKLKRLFSGKSLTGTGSPAATAAAATIATSTSFRRKQVVVAGNGGSIRPKVHDHGKENSASINIENMDPPLPVIKRVPKQGGDKAAAAAADSDTLWQRRSRGVTLKSLQLQPIQLNTCQEPTTV